MRFMRLLIRKWQHLVVFVCGFSLLSLIGFDFILMEIHYGNTTYEGTLETFGSLLASFVSALIGLSVSSRISARSFSRVVTAAVTYILSFYILIGLLISIGGDSHDLGILVYGVCFGVLTVLLVILRSTINWIQLMRKT